MHVYAIIEYRTDTKKPGSESLLSLVDHDNGTVCYGAVYRSEVAAENFASKLNEAESSDPYSVVRYRVVVLSVL